MSSAPLPEGAERRAAVESEESDEIARHKASQDVLEPGATAESALELVRLLVAERAELPTEAVCDEHRLLGDLHLNSLTVSQVVVEAARRLGLAPPLAPTEYALATVAEMAKSLEEMAAGGSNHLPASDDAPGVAAWVRSFTVELSEQPLRLAPVPAGVGDWHCFAAETCTLAPRLREAFARLEGKGVVVCLPPEMDERHLSLLLEGAWAISEEGIERFVLVQQGRGAAAFARSLKLEIPQTCVAVVERAGQSPTQRRMGAGRGTGLCRLHGSLLRRGGRPARSRAATSAASQRADGGAARRGRPHSGHGRREGNRGRMRALTGT